MIQVAGFINHVVTDSLAKDQSIVLCIFWELELEYGFTVIVFLQVAYV